MESEKNEILQFFDNQELTISFINKYSLSTLMEAESVLSHEC